LYQYLPFASYYQYYFYGDVTSSAICYQIPFLGFTGYVSQAIAHYLTQALNFSLE
jgi:hypothetical protein